MKWTRCDQHSLCNCLTAETYWLLLFKFKRITFTFHPSAEQTALIDISSSYLLTVWWRFNFPPVNLVCVVFFWLGLILLLSVLAANAAPVFNKLGKGGGCKSLHHCPPCSGQNFAPKWAEEEQFCNVMKNLLMILGALGCFAPCAGYA